MTIRLVHDPDDYDERTEEEKQEELEQWHQESDEADEENRCRHEAEEDEGKVPQTPDAGFSGIEIPGQARDPPDDTSSGLSSLSCLR